MDIKKRIIKIGVIIGMLLIGIILIILVFVGGPFFLEWIMFETEYFPFNMPIRFPREVWFGFIGSYLGAAGTVLLGLLALFQNRQYKKLADKSDQRFFDLQNDITQFVKAMYYPVLTLVLNNKPPWNWTENDFIDTDNVINILIKYSDFDSRPKSFHDIFERYKTYTFTFKNQGEKVVRNFKCDEVKINGEKLTGKWMYDASNYDIQVDKLIYFIFATKLDMYKSIKKVN